MAPNSIDESHLKRLIVDAFDALPEPDALRLKATEDRLTRNLSPSPTRPKPSLWYWWVIGALAATGAAAWWVGERMRQDEMPQIEQPVESAVLKDPSWKQQPADAAEEAQTRQNAERKLEEKQQRSPAVIYQRER